MKRNFKYLITTFLLSFGIMFCFNVEVKASKLNIYNGSNTPSGAITGSCNEAWRNGFCRYGKNRGTRITVIYYNHESSYEVLGRSIDVFPNDKTFYSGTRYYNQKVNSKVALSGSVKIGPSLTDGGRDFIKDPSMFSTDNFTPIDSNYIYAIIPGLPTDGKNESGYWERVFLKETVDASGNIIEDSIGNTLIKLATGDGNVSNGASLSDTTFWNKETQLADPNGDASKIGYRILIEPLYIWAGQTSNKAGGKGSWKPDGKYYVMTPTEYASLAWNTTSYIGAAQVSHYLYLSERLFTSFDDIGIYTPKFPCSDWGGKNVCLASDVQFPGKRQLGHALNIVDIGEHFVKKCDYETGEGFPPKDRKKGELTAQEIECCEEKLQEIRNEYKVVQIPEPCMPTSSSVDAFINCMNVYFQGNTTTEKLWEEEKQKLLDFNEDYPACSIVGCEFQPLIQIEETYVSCVQSMDTITWMNSVIQCDETICEINYKLELQTYEKNHLLCDLEEWKKRIPTHNCKKPECDENDANAFLDEACCIEFEEKMKLEYSGQGLSQAEIKEKIEDWFNESGKEFRQNCLKKPCNINDKTLTKECCDELMESYPEKSDEFWIGKGCKIDDKDKCTWHDYADELIENLKQMMGADCSIETNTKLEANDTTNWECIFESDNISLGSKEEIFKDYYVKYSNPYCAVYCREDVKYDFPNGNMIVKAGSHFTVGETGHVPEWKNVQFSSTRECKTSGSTRDDESKEINTSKFEGDWKKANARVISTWDLWKIAEQQEWSYAHSVQSPTLNCDYRCTEPCTKCDEDGCTISCCKMEPKGYWMYPAQVFYAPFESRKQDITPVKWCSTLGHPSTGSAFKHKAHTDAIDEMETIENDIHACTSWDKFSKYEHATFNHSNVKAIRYAKYPAYEDFVDYKEFSPDLLIDYDEFTHDEYDYNDLLKKEEFIKTDTNEFATTGDVMEKKYNCDYDPPAPGKVTCKDSRSFEFSNKKEIFATYSKEIKYTLKDGVFNTILKPQGTAVNGSEAGSSSSQIYIDLGYSALHVHFMTPTGRYDIGLTYPGFTPGEKATGSKLKHNFDQLVEDSYKYDCTYVVDNEIIENDDPNCEGDNCFPCKSDNCDPAGLRGLNLIYRPISLGEPFPGLDGEGRNPGSNWNDASLIKNIITNNRGVKGNVIYQKAPMYQITLTPALIQQIRKYNESTTYNDFNMDCTAEGKECKSYFIRGNEEESASNFSNAFQTCSISGKRGSSTCCGIGNWNDCDDKDGITRR